jgi:PTH1 family peptidyl-tRNA hydrolase
LQNFFEEANSGLVQCVVGLGNPGRRYRSTRHNVGYNVVGSLAHSLRTALKEGSGEYLFSECMVDERRILLAVPSTYMNESGIAVAQLCQHFSLSPSGLLIVSDDFQLPLGTLRIRSEGSDGGHNGLASVIEHLQTEKIPRLRVGIAGSTCPGEDRKELMASYVLSPFEDDEVTLAAKMTDHARDALLAFIQHGIQFAMNNFNKSFLAAGPDTGELEK